MPSLFPILRAVIDQDRRNGRFLLLGSASPDLLKHTSESMAGRIVYHELFPFSLAEVKNATENVRNLWLRGGYPESFLAEDEEKSFRWREAFLQTYLERDIPQLGIHISSIQMRRFLTMVAHSHGQLWNASKIANSLGVSAPTIRSYMDIFEKTFLIRKAEPYHINIKKRLVKSPKIFLCDSGILHTLLGIHTFEDAFSHPALGSSWEGFVLEQLSSLSSRNRQEIYFFRTSAGAEIDFLLLSRKKRLIAIEVKYSLSPKLTKSFWNAFRDLSCGKGYVVYPGDEIYPLQKNVFALPIAQISEIFKQKIP
ncbi:DUF4143 domain-containing protein [Candidatus Peregrinibacteria bacterium]|nr:DUF4143 domain-containing protein [Candidatus Peregrinibacteria bacterium]